MHKTDGMRQIRQTFIMIPFQKERGEFWEMSSALIKLVNIFHSQNWSYKKQLSLGSIQSFSSEVNASLHSLYLFYWREKT